MSKKSDISDEDKKLFREAMKGVKRIAHNKVTSKTKPISTRRIQPKQKETNSNQFEFSDYEKLEPVYSEDLLYYARSGIQHKILRNLRTGQYNVEAVLDLHGMTIEQARIALSQFLVRCKRNGKRHVLMIHGKGRENSKPILKNKLNHWLRQTEEVLAFCSATAKDGRGGALYVLLRR